MNKYYFYDCGIRNSVIDNFNELSNRNDHGALWEQFLIVERMKRNDYKRVDAASYFWRTYTGVEIDYVEEAGGILSGFELKWGSNTRARLPQTWVDNYPRSRWMLVDQRNYLDFVL